MKVVNTSEILSYTPKLGSHPRSCHREKKINSSSAHHRNEIMQQTYDRPTSYNMNKQDHSV